MEEFKDYQPPDWDELFMRQVYLIASKSRDPSTKIGSILVKDNRVISQGYNGLCRNIEYNDISRLVRPEKYFWFEHSERSCIYNCAMNGINTSLSTLYTNSIPCCDCTRAIIQSYIIEIVVHKQWVDLEQDLRKKEKGSKSPYLLEHHHRSKQMLMESKTKLRIFDKQLNVYGYLSGNKILI